MENCDLVRDTLELVIVEDKASSVKEAQETLFDKPEKLPIINTRRERGRVSRRTGRNVRRRGEQPSFLVEAQSQSDGEGWRTRCCVV